MGVPQLAPRDRAAFAPMGGPRMPSHDRARRAPEPFVGPDVGELYCAHSKRLERIVRLGVQAPDPVIEDACQFAWARLVHHQARVRRETAFGWLVKTALHEALKLLGSGCREQSLDAELDERGEISTPDLRPGPPELYDQRERLKTLTALPARQRRLMWLYGLGLTYDEIASRDGCTSRTVERQIKRARAALLAAENSAGPCDEDEREPEVFAADSRIGNRAPSLRPRRSTPKLPTPQRAIALE